MYKKQAVTIVAAIMLLCLYVLIFSFSAQNGEQSGGLSQMISEQCVEFMGQLSGQSWTSVFRQELTAIFENPIRKLAHFTEYACMGILVYTMWRPWMCRNRKLYLLVCLWVCLSAAGDEFHQLFVPGRMGSVKDVLLDTCGGVFGTFICVLLDKRFSNRKRMKNKDKNKNKDNNKDNNKN